MTTPVFAFPGHFPTSRLRRLRQADWIRTIVREVHLRPEHLILPLFLVEGQGQTQPISAMPGIERLSIDKALHLAERAFRLGIRAVALFPVIAPADKALDERLACAADNLIHRAVRALKAHLPQMGVICDVALDPYTTHGHDGILRDNKIDNDLSSRALVRMALAQAEAGVDMVAPSDMMDGRIGAIRQALEQQGFHDTLILSYAAKYASAFYGPFRSALGSDLALKGDKKTYQMQPTNSSEALREVGLDLAEGADIVMVKPGLAYLDIVSKIKASYGVPTFVYQVSGEYAMLRFAALAGAVDGRLALLESLLAFRRAGADAIFTYAALEAAEELRQLDT
jgi:porphobilinogen synthase